jgi:anti-anti-sigma factor
VPRAEKTARFEAAQVGPTTFVITVSGEVDDASAAELGDLLLPLAATKGARVVLDLLRVHDLDSAPLAVVVEAAQLLERSGRRLTLVASSRHLTEIVYASGLDRIARLDRSLNEGLAHAN